MGIMWVHAGLMSCSLVAVLSGIGVARFARKQKWWLKTHRALAGSGAAAALAGFAAAFIMVAQSGGPHLRVPHAFLGAVTLLAMVALPALGSYMLKAKPKERAAALRRAHRAAGRVAAVLLTLTVLSGLNLAGLI